MSSLLMEADNRAWHKYASCGDVTTFLLLVSISFSLLVFFHASFLFFVTFLPLFCGCQALRPFHFLLVDLH